MRVASIIRATAEVFGVSVDDILGPSRKRHIVWPRWVAMKAVRDTTDLSLPQIGGVFGGRDHTTVFHGLENYGNLPKEVRNKMPEVIGTAAKTSIESDLAEKIKIDVRMRRISRLVQEFRT